MAPVPTWHGARDWAVLEILTAANMDTYVSNNTLHLYTMQGSHIYNSAAVLTANVTTVTHTFNSEYYDLCTAFSPSEWHSTSTNPGRITIPPSAPATAYYLVFSTAQFALNTTGDRFTRIRKNGATPLVDLTQRASSTLAPVMSSAIIARLAAADYIEFQTYQDSGGNLNVNFLEMGIMMLKG